MSIKGRTVGLLSKVAVVGPWRSVFEKTLVYLRHRHPTSRTIASFCQHFGSMLIEREGSSFSRFAVLESGGLMFCGGEKSVAQSSLSYYFSGTITGQHEDERGVVQLLRRLVKAGDVFFDLGANFGFYSFYLTPLCGSSGTVHAFEPNPCLIPLLLRSIEINRQYGNIHLNAVAVGKEAGRYVPLYGPDRIGCSSLYPHEWLNRNSSVLVPVVTIDEYVREKRIERIDIMKIDIEGAELDALQGMEDTFRLCPPKVIICELTLLPEQDNPLRCAPEVLKRSSSAADPRELSDFLIQRGYELWNIGVEGLLHPWEVSKLSAVSLKIANVAFVHRQFQPVRPEVFVYRQSEPMPRARQTRV